MNSHLLEAKDILFKTKFKTKMLMRAFEKYVKNILN